MRLLGGAVTTPMKAHTKIFLGLLVGATVGAIAHLPSAEPLRELVLALEPIGTAFIKLITMVVVPLVVASLFVGVASLGDVRRLGRIGGRTLVYFILTTFVAAVIGLAVGLLMNVGGRLELAVDRVTSTDAMAQGVGAVEMVARVPSFAQTLLAMIPSNPFAAAAQGDLLALIVAVCLFGAAAATIQSDGRRALLAFFQGVNDVARVIVTWLMKTAPVAVCILVAGTVARYGADRLASLAWFALTVVIALVAHVAITLLPLLRIVARTNVMFFFRSVSDALLLAFSTASSSAALPVSLAAAHTRLGVPNEIASFVLPAGSTLNKNASACYKAVTALFLAGQFGLVLGPGQLVTVVLASTVAAFAGPGVPGSSLVTTLIVLNAIGLGDHAAAGIALVVGVDRPLDMCRSCVNTIGNLVGTLIVARGEQA